jgi:hypothetical protein
MMVWRYHGKGWSDRSIVGVRFLSAALLGGKRQGVRVSATLARYHYLDPSTEGHDWIGKTKKIHVMDNN